MPKKILSAVLCLLIAVSFTACSSVETATALGKQRLTTSEYETAGHIHSKIWGVYLLSLPLFSGSGIKCGKTEVFTDTVTVSNAVRLLSQNAKDKLGSSILSDMSSETTSFYIFPCFVYCSAE